MGAGGADGAAGPQASFQTCAPASAGQVPTLRASSGFPNRAPEAGRWFEGVDVDIPEPTTTSWGTVGSPVLVGIHPGVAEPPGFTADSGCARGRSAQQPRVPGLVQSRDQLEQTRSATRRIQVPIRSAPGEARVNA